METGLQMKEKLETDKLFFILKRLTAGIPIIFCMINAFVTRHSTKNSDDSPHKSCQIEIYFKS